MSKLLQVLVMLFCAAGIAKDYTPAEIKALLAAAEKGLSRLPSRLLALWWSLSRHLSS
jgi:hypothetical protein